jgi:GNAT superfamily N-acetyltransferase
MKTRILPREEWARLERSQMPPFPGVRAEDVAVVVVEDAEKVIGCMTVLRATHFEGLWLDPEQRSAGVSRALVRAAVKAARLWTDDWVFAGAADDRMRDVLDRLGAIRLPIESYVMALGGEACRRL